MERERALTALCIAARRAGKMYFGGESHVRALGTRRDLARFAKERALDEGFEMEHDLVAYIETGKAPEDLHE